MPRPKSAIPKLCHDRSRDRAFVKVDGKFIALGAWGSPEAQAAYGRLIADIASGRDPSREKPPTAASNSTSVTLNEVFLAFLLHAQDHYRNPKTGKPSAELDCFRSAIRPARDLFGETDVVAFGPVRLTQVRDQYIAKGWSRGFINKSVVRLRHIFKWAISKELCPVAVLQGLQALEPLRAGKSAARETKRRQAVPPEHIEAVRPFLTDQCRELFDLLRWSGARPAELMSLTGAMIDRSGPVWVATLPDHKNAWRGLDRRIMFGPKCQMILRRWLQADPDKLLFKMHSNTLTAALRSACPKAGVPIFTAYSMRHTRATEVRDQMGLEHAQAALGHQNPSMTSHYTSKLDALAVDVAARCG